MPELPEVETVCRGLEFMIKGRQINRVLCQRESLRYPLPPLLSERVSGSTVKSIQRRAKLILMHLDNDLTWVMHLGMSGRIYQLASPSPGKHDHVLIYTNEDVCIAFNDTRRFGYMDLLPTGQLSESIHLRNLGVEPLEEDLVPDYAYRKSQRTQRPIKSFLLDQQIIAGLGNIYVCESLWLAGIHPERPSCTLSLLEWQKLIPAIKQVLIAAIAAGGSTLRDYRQVSGELGYFQHTFVVYDCEGESCKRPQCHGTIKRIVQSGRSTFFCQSCQS